MNAVDHARITSDCNESGVLRPGIVSKLTSYFVAVHLGHGDVKHDKARGEFLREPQSLPTVSGRCHFETYALEQQSDNFDGISVVIDYDYLRKIPRVHTSLLNWPMTSNCFVGRHGTPTALTQISVRPANLSVIVTPHRQAARPPE